MSQFSTQNATIPVATGPLLRRTLARPCGQAEPSPSSTARVPDSPSRVAPASSIARASVGGADSAAGFDAQPVADGRRPSAPPRAPTRRRRDEIRSRSSRNPRRASSAARHTSTRAARRRGRAAPPTPRSPSVRRRRDRGADRGDVGPHGGEVTGQRGADVDHHVDLVGAGRDRQPASCALIAEQCLPEGNPATVGDARRPGGAQRRWPSSTIDGDTHTAYTPSSAASVDEAATSASVASGLSRVWSTRAAATPRSGAVVASQRLAPSRTVLRCRRGCSRVRDHRRRRRPPAATVRGSSWSCRAAANSANCQWHMNWARMPGVSASGAERQHLGPRLVGLRVGARLPGGRPARRRRIHAQAGRSPQCAHSVWSTIRRAGNGSASAPAPARRISSATQQQAAAATGAATWDSHPTQRDFPWISRILGRTSTR